MSECWRDGPGYERPISDGRKVCYGGWVQLKRSERLFPDPTVVWRPYPTIMDGMALGPVVFDRGVWEGVLSLIVLDGGLGPRAYGVQIKCVAYAAFEEMLYSVANHGDQRANYDGHVFIKEAEKSALLSAYEKTISWMPKPRHFLFIGDDFCYETLGLDAPSIRSFKSRDEAYAWQPVPGAA